MNYSDTFDTLPDHLQKEVDRVVQHNGLVKNAVLAVHAPRHAFTWAGAAGLADPDMARLMRPDDQFRSASVGKMICATTVLLLVADGHISLDTPIATYLADAVLDNLFIVDGHAYTSDVTVRQLLNHTSGVANYFAHAAFQERLLGEPDALWSPQEVLAWVRTHAQAVFPPGDGWHYSDTGYLLLGLIIEATTGRALHNVYRARVFDPLGMDATYVVFREPPRPASSGQSASHVFFGDIDYTSAQSLSADWSGGGLVTTAMDLQRFMQAFVEGRVFRQPQHQALMRAWTPTGEPGVSYGLGVRHFDLEQLMGPGFGELWGHTGSSRSFMLYWSPHAITLTGTLNQDIAEGIFSSAYPVAGLVRDIIDTLMNTLPAG